MKTIKCPDCGGEFRAATREEILDILYDHYKRDHNEIISTVTEAEKKAWMERFERDWAAAEETT